MKYSKLVFIFSLLLFYSCKGPMNLSQPKDKNILTEREKIELMAEFMDGSREKITGNFEKAAHHFNRSLKIDPNHAPSMFELASIYEFQKKDALALNLIKEATRIDPKNEWYNLLLASLYAKNGHFSESAKVYKQLSETYPGKIEYYYEWANSLLFQNKYKEAIEVYNSIENNIGITEEISLQKEKIWLRMGNQENAVNELKILIKEFPKEARYYGMLAELYQTMGKKDLAMETFNEIKKIDPKNPYVHLSLSNFYREKGEKEKSFEEMQIAFSNPELNIDTKVNILLTYYAAGTAQPELLEQAHRLCKVLTETHPDDPKAYSIYGDFLYRDKKVMEAREQFRNAIKLDKSKFPIWNQLMLIESEVKDYEALYSESLEAIDLFPNQPSFYFFNGFAAIQKRNYEEAIKTLNAGKELVIDNNPLLEQFYSTLGDAYYSIKEYANSDSSYERALQINADNIYVLNNYSYYLSLREENLEKAEKMSKRSNELDPNSPSFMDTYAWILYQMGRYGDAKKWIEKAISAGAENNGTILEHYGDILFRLNDQEGAIKYWNKAKEAGGGSELLEKKISSKMLTE